MCISHCFQRQAPSRFSICFHTASFPRHFDPPTQDSVILHPCHTCTPPHTTSAAIAATSAAPLPATLCATAAALDVAAADALLAAELMLLVALAIDPLLLLAELAPVPEAWKLAQLIGLPLLSATTIDKSPKYASVPLAVEV